MVYSTAVLLEWVAAFLLAIEAIKLENLVLLRKRYSGFHSSLFPIMSDAEWDTTRGKVIFWGLLLFAFLLGALQFLAVARIGNTWTELASIPTPTVVDYISMPFFLGITILVCTYFGCWTLFLLDWLLRFPIQGLLFVERNTANGIVGIMGFAIFSVATALKLLAH